MSTPEEIDRNTLTDHDQSARNGVTTTSSADPPMGVTEAIDQLRALVCGLGIGLLIVSLAFTAYVFKQNRDLVAAKTMHESQIARLQDNERSVNFLVDTLVKYSAGKPELMALLARHGLKALPPSAASAPSLAAPAQQ